MSASRRSPWYYPWAPLGIGALTFAAVVALLLAGPPAQQAQAAPALTPQAAVGYQTTDKLVLTVNLPRAEKPQPADTLRVELVAADGKVLDERRAQSAARRRTHLPPFRAGVAEGRRRQVDAALHLRRREDGNAAGQGAAR